jgi:hypothetical protein
MHLLRFPALAVFLIPGAVLAGEVPIPAPPLPESRPVSVEEARVVAGRVFGGRILTQREDERAWVFQTAGFADDRPCPLKDIRGESCEELRYVPSTIRVYRQSWVGAVSGHLGRNRVVVVDLESDTRPISSSGICGVLVFPGPDVSPKPSPAMVWYLNRAGSSVGLQLEDVDADGALDLIYTYDQVMTGGVWVVPRDVWTAVDLAPARLVSSGERVSGVATSAFEGLPLHQDDDDGFVRGSYRFVPLDPGSPKVLVFERARFPGPEWSLLIVADLGDGWREVLSGDSGGKADEGSVPCSPAEVPGALSFAARERLMALEAVCREARRVADAPPLARIFHAMGLYASGMRLLGAAAEMAAARDLTEGAWPLAFLLSLHAAWTADAVYRETFDGTFAPAEGSLWESAGLPAL